MTLSDARTEFLQPFGVQIEWSHGGQDLRRLPVQLLRTLTRAHRLLILRGFQLFERAELVLYCRSWGALLEWDFGPVLELKVHETPKNYLFTRGNVPFHWDGAFAAAEPQFLFFQCRKAPLPGTGGETLFSDTTRVWKAAGPQERSTWESVSITYTSDKVAHYGGRRTAPLVSRHPFTGETTLRFAEPPDENTAPLNPLLLDVSGVPSGEAEPILARLSALLYDRRHCFTHQWKDGDIVVADNHALLHGRHAFQTHSPRYLERVHIL